MAFRAAWQAGRSWSHIPVLLAAVILTSAPSVVRSQQPAQGRLQEIVVRGRSLEGNRLGVSADRAVSVYLPPSYGGGSRRYPVLYLLHGIMDANTTWTQPWGSPSDAEAGFATIPQLMDRGIADGLLQEMIIVMPDAEKTCHYTDSPVKGNWATFIGRELVDHIDRTYRTVPQGHARGIMGHSMGGHGALKLAMLNPGRFGAVFAMNPSLLGWGADVSEDNPRLSAMPQAEGLGALASQDFYVQAAVGIGQCFAPDPTAPLLTSAPFIEVEGTGRRASPARARWTEQMPLYMAPRHAGALRQLRGLRFDSAFEDEFAHIPLTTRAFARVLDSLGIDHTFEMYNGDHRNRLWGAEGRLFTEALPFFSRILRPTAPAEPRVAVAPSGGAAQEALWAAARSGDTVRAAAALRSGASAIALDTVGPESGGRRSGRRALNYAALHNNARMIRWLVSHGADLKATNNSGFTALHHAAEKGAYHAAEALIELGADLDARLPSGSTPLRVAQQNKHALVVRLLERARQREREPGLSPAPPAAFRER